ncbi:MAG: DMT family transporter [Bacteroidota bacterium]|nr:DMT family transporter [Bacteroidota bacterium]
MKGKYHYHLLLHFTILIWGFTGIIGKFLELTELSSSYIVFWRMLIGWTTLLIYLIFKKQKVLIERKSALKFLGNGILIALHWYCFFEAIVRSNVSIALVFLSTTALFTSFVEPLITKKKFNPKELITSVLVVIGIIVIMNDLNFSENETYLSAIVFSLLAALLAALFSVYNSVFVKEHHSGVISLYELFGGFVFISLLFLLSGDIVVSELHLTMEQFSWLFLLGTICTSFAFLMGVYVMRFIPAYTVNLSVNLEPIYAIILALLFFKDSELMDINFYIGSAIVVGSILLNALFKKQKKAA